MTEPSWRTGAGMVLLLSLVAIWVLLVASLASIVGSWPILVQTLFYLVTGVIWIFPMRPIIRWMLTGRFRKD